MKQRYRLLTAIAFCGILGSTTKAQNLADFANEGDKNLAAKNYEGAIKNYLAALELDSTNTDFTTAFNLGLAYEGLNDYQQSITAFKQSILKGNSEGLLFKKIKENAELAKCDDCMEKIFIDIRENREDLSPLMNEKLFYIFASKQENRKAIDCAQAVLENNPNHFPLLKNVGLIYNNANKSDSALIYLERAHELKNEDETVNKVIGLIYFNICESKMAAEVSNYEKLSNKTHSAHNTMMYNRQNYVRQYYDKSVKHLESANNKLNDPELSKLITRMRQSLDAYKK
ncbi:MAG: hypothetical protein RR202_08930 [Bacteroidales bacterium]